MNEIIKGLIDRAEPLISIHGINQASWMRDTDDRRRGPWKTLEYSITSVHSYKQPGACLYFVIGPDEGLRYVGKTTGRFDTRWRMARALNAQSGSVLPQRKLFHSECMKYIIPEIETHPSFDGFSLNEGGQFLVKRIFAAKIREIIRKEFPESVSWTDKDVVEKTESWICMQKSADCGDIQLAKWNIALTKYREKS